MIAHPRKTELRAYDDGEGTRISRATLRLHLAGCSRCRGRLEVLTAERTAVSMALAALSPSPDVAAGWARVQLRLGASPAAARRAAWSWRSAAAGSLAAAAVMLVATAAMRAAEGAGAGRSDEAPIAAAEESVLDRVQRLVVGRETAFAPAADEQQIVTAALLVLRDRGGAEVRNLCCGDYDAGGPSDDGFLTLNRPSEDVSTVVVYEDVDNSGDLSAGDVIRFVSQRGVVETNAADSLRSPEGRRPRA